MNLCNLIRLELLSGPLTAVECASILELERAVVSTGFGCLMNMGDVTRFGLREDVAGSPQPIWELSTRGIVRIYSNREMNVPQRITKIELTPSVIAAHPFVVYRPNDKKVIGRFASLYCAAQTALFNGRKMDRNIDGEIKWLEPAVVRDERDGSVHEPGELACLEIRDLEKLVYDFPKGGGARQLRQRFVRAGYDEVA